MDRRGFLGAVAATVTAALMRREEPAVQEVSVQIRAMDADAFAEHLRMTAKTETGRWSSRRHQHLTIGPDSDLEFKGDGMSTRFRDLYLARGTVLPEGFRNSGMRVWYL